MLYQKTNTPYIGVFKLGSGEEFIGRVVEETAISYTIEKPRCLVPTQQGLQFAPFMMLADQGANVNIPKPVIHSTPAPAWSSAYETNITGIALPQKSSIIS